jgi:ketosteroid isomerase-like protein
VSPDRLSLAALDAQEETFARAFAAGDIRLARDLYHPEVVYMSPTARLYGWPQPIVGIDKTLEFVQLTISECRNIAYRAAERAVIADDAGAYVRVLFDWDGVGQRLRSNYVVVYRYTDASISGQELYYDPAGPFDQPAIEL